MRIRCNADRECPARTGPAGYGAGVGRTAHRAGGEGRPGRAGPPAAQPAGPDHRGRSAGRDVAHRPPGAAPEHDLAAARRSGPARRLLVRPAPRRQPPARAVVRRQRRRLRSRRPVIAITAAGRSSSTIKARSPSPSATTISCSSRAPTAPDRSPSSRSPEPAQAAHSTWSPAAATSSSARPAHAERETGAECRAAAHAARIHFHAPCRTPQTN